MVGGDLQASKPDVRLGLSRAGVTGVQKAIRIRHDGREKTFAAEISCTVDLDPSQKGVHMSRFSELFNDSLFGEAIDEVVIGEAFHVVTDTGGDVLGRYRVRASAALESVEADVPVGAGSGPAGRSCRT